MPRTPTDAERAEAATVREREQRERAARRLERAARWCVRLVARTVPGGTFALSMSDFDGEEWAARASRARVREGRAYLRDACAKSPELAEAVRAWRAARRARVRLSMSADLV